MITVLEKTLLGLGLNWDLFMCGKKKLLNFALTGDCNDERGMCIQT